MKILILLLASCLAQELLHHEGMMISYSKEYLAKDMFELARRILTNTKNFKFEDISKTEDYGLFNISSYIFNIEIKELESNISDLVNNTAYNDYKFSITSSKNAIKYNLTFAWKVMAMNINIGYGIGVVDILSKAFMMYVNMPGSENEVFSGELDIKFELKQLEIKGIGATNELKNWVSKQLNDCAVNDLSKAILDNSKVYIKKNFAIDFLEANSSTNNTRLFFKNTPLNTNLINNYLWLSFKTEIKNNNSKTYVFSNNNYTVTKKPLRGLGVYLSSEHIVGALNLVFADKKFDINFRSSDHYGKISDFFVAMPNLFVGYKANDSLNITCTLEDIRYIKENKYAKATLQCNFRVKQNVVLCTTMTSRLKLIPYTAERLYLFTGLINETHLEELKTEPSDMDISLFFSQFFLSYLKNNDHKVIDSKLDVPGIEYELRRENYYKEIMNNEDYYVAYYTVK